MLLEVEGSLLVFRKVEGLCFCSWRLKVFALKEVEGFCSCFWMLKVFVIYFEYWRFLLILLDVEGYYVTFLFFIFYSWMLKVLTFGFRCWKFLFLFLNIAGFYFCYFYAIRPNFHYVSIHQHQNYVYKVRFFQKYLKFYFNLPNHKHNIWFYLQVCKLWFSLYQCSIHYILVTNKLHVSDSIVVN